MFYHGKYPDQLKNDKFEQGPILDVRKSPERACHLAKNAFDDAIQSLGQADVQMDQTMRDSLTILQLLRDDLILWAAELKNQ